MLCEFGDDLSVLALLHILADVWFWAERGEMLSARLRTHWGDVCPQEMHAFVDGEIQKFRARAQPLVEAALSWKAESAGDLFCELSTLTGPVVMTNHYFNDMAFRLLEHKAGRSQVLGLESFPNTAVKPEILQRELKVFRKQWRMYWQVLSQRGELSPFRERWFGAVRLAIWAGWRFVRI